MRELACGMNLSLDGYIAAPDDDLGWSVPSDELFQWWSDRVNLNLVETRTLPDGVLLTRYETRR